MLAGQMRNTMEPARAAVETQPQCNENTTRAQVPAWVHLPEHGLPGDVAMAVCESLFITQNILLPGFECDLLIHEATFDNASTVEAIRKNHSTWDEAISIARQ